MQTVFIATFITYHLCQAMINNKRNTRSVAKQNITFTFTQAGTFIVIL